VLQKRSHGRKKKEASSKNRNAQQATPRKGQKKKKHSMGRHRVQGLPRGRVKKVTHEGKRGETTEEKKRWWTSISRESLAHGEGKGDEKRGKGDMPRQKRETPPFEETHDNLGNERARLLN